MVEIKFRNNLEVADLAGKSLADVRQDYKAKFDIPDKARVKINDRKVRPTREAEIRLRDCDEVHFAVEKGGKGALLVGALLLALAVTGGVFAFGYLTSTTTLAVTSAGGDFASVAPAAGAPTWTVWGHLKGSIGSGNLFTVNTFTPNYTGNLVTTVSIANGADLVHVYRVLSLFLYATDSSDTQIDINSDNVVNSQDYALLTLDNGAVNMYIDQLSGSDNYTIKVQKGFYVANVFPQYGGGWPASSWQPILYADVGQR